MARQRAFARRADEWIDSLKGVKAEQTVQGYRRVLRMIEREAKAMGMPPNITDWGENEILAFKSQWVGRVMPKTYHYRFAVLGGLLSFHGNGIISVMRSRRRLVLAPAKRGLVRDMEHGQRAALFGLADGTQRMALVLGFGLGLRLGEIVGVRLSDIRGDQLLVRRAKGGRIRTVPIEVPVMAEMDRYKRGLRAEHVHQARAQGWNGTDPGTLLVHCYRGKLTPYTTDGLANALRRLSLRVGFPFSAHDMRRTCATELADRDVALERIQELLGHQDIETTREYVRVRPRRLREAVSGYQAALCTEMGLANGT